MKLSEKFKRRYAIALTCAVPLLLLIPSISIGIYSNTSFIISFADLVLQAGLLLLFMTICGRIGLNTFLLSPLMLMAGFQIVLLFLYSDGSIIGVDMFLNVVTTNPDEAGELLSNLKTAISLVGCIYIPPLIAATVAMCYKIKLENPAKKRLRQAGCAITGLGVAILIICKCFIGGYNINERLYPYNVLYNMGIAVKRTIDVSQYHKMSAGYAYDARSVRPADQREVYVAVIGETCRACNWQLYGYPRPTTPKLAAIDDSRLAVYTNVLSESNTTHKAVPLMLSPLTVNTFNDEINSTKSIITAFKECGFHTAYVSMQGHNGSYIDFFADEADEVYFLRDNDCRFQGDYDADMLTALDSLLTGNNGKLFIVLHGYGSHFNYSDRYPAEDAYFTPENASEAKAANRGELVNAYDNSIRHTDRFLAGVIQRLDSLDCIGAMLFTSDHGEDIFDDSRKRFLHSSPTPTFTQLNVPMLLYINGPMAEEYKELLHVAKSHEKTAISSSESYAPTLLHIAGITTPRIDESNALTSTWLRPVRERLFLSDRNEPLTLDKAGFRAEDFARLSELESANRQE